MKNNKKNIKKGGGDYSLKYLKLFNLFLNMWKAIRAGKREKAEGALYKLNDEVDKLIEEV